MSQGIIVCSKCKREIHQNDAAGWHQKLRQYSHCEDNSLICEDAYATYPKSKDDIIGKWCGQDELLLPCPFCKGQADFEERRTGWIVRCNRRFLPNVENILCPMNMRTHVCRTKEEAGKSWNTRVPPDYSSPEQPPDNLSPTCPTCGYIGKGCGMLVCQSKGVIPISKKGLLAYFDQLAKDGKIVTTADWLADVGMLVVNEVRKESKLRIEELNKYIIELEHTDDDDL